MTEFTRLAKNACAVGFAGALLWSGCGGAHHISASDGLQPASEQQRILTIAAINKLRSVFSAGACQSIYDDASQPFRSQTEVDWLYQCNQLRKNLGDWHRFEVRSMETYGPSKQWVLVEVSAEFVKARRQVGMTWLLDGRAPKLSSLAIEEHGTWRQIPSIQRGVLMDTPLASALSS